jgi:hypothetical protein
MGTFFSKFIKPPFSSRLKIPVSRVMPRVPAGGQITRYFGHHIIAAELGASFEKPP